MKNHFQSNVQDQLNRSQESINTIKNANNHFSKMMSDLNDTNKKIEDEMRLKERIIEINNEAYREKSNTITYIMGLSIGFTLFIMAIVGYLSKIFSTNSTFMLIVFGLISIVVTFLLIDRTGAGSKLKDIAQNIQDKIVHKGDRFNRQALEWVDGQLSLS